MILYNVLSCPRMKTNTQPVEKRYHQRNFRPSPANEKRIELAQSLGLNVSQLINQVLEERFDAVLEEKSIRLEKALKVVRGAGFEPATPTVSR